MEKKSKYYGLNPHQYEDIYFQADVPLEDVREEVKRVWIYYGNLVLLLFIIFGSFLKIPHQVELGFELRDVYNNEEIISFNEDIYIDSICVEVGDSISIGTPLAKISGIKLSKLLSEYETATSNINFHGKQDSLLLNVRVEQKKLEWEEVNNRIKANDIETVNQLRLIEIKRVGLKDILELANADYSRNKILFEKGTISQADYEKIEKEYKIAVNIYDLHEADNKILIKKLEFERNSLLKRQQNIYSQLSELDITYNVERIELKNRSLQLLDLIQKYYGPFEIQNNSIIIRAQKEGIVSFKSNSENLLVQNNPIVKIYKRQNEFVALSSSPSNLIGRIKDNYDVKLKLASYPHYDWGMMTGKIRNLSYTPNQNGDFPFEVEVVDYGNFLSLIKKGMKGKLSVIIEEKPLFAYIFSGIKREMHNAIES